MEFQTVQTQGQAETVLRIVQNSNPLSGTSTNTLAIGSPVILETNTASLPSTTTSTTQQKQNYVNRPATQTSIVNNLMVGVLVRGPRTDYLEREALGLAQMYGVCTAAVVVPTGGAGVGAALIPNSDGTLNPVSGPVTAAATSTSGHTEVPALGCLAVLMEAQATSGATYAATPRVHLRCM